MKELSELKKMSNTIPHHLTPMTEEKCIGIIKMMYRTKLVKSISQLIDIVGKYGYDEEERDVLNIHKSNLHSDWKRLNNDYIREYIKQLNAGEKSQTVVIKDSASDKDNPKGMLNSDALATFYKKEFLNSDLFVVVSSDVKRVTVVKSRYFNLTMKGQL